MTLSVRPEDVELSESRPQGANVREGLVEAKVFLGESVHFQVKVGGRALLASAHPSLRTPIGNRIFLRIDPEKCVAIRE